MDSRPSDYPPHQQQTQQETHSASAQYTPAPDVKYSAGSASTPSGSDYSLNPSSARSETFPGHVRHPPYSDSSQRYYANGVHSAGNMAQPQSPSTPLEEHAHHPSHASQSAPSNAPVPIDPSISASSPTYPPHHYSPYGPPQGMEHGYHPMYARPEYGYPPPHGMPGPYGHVQTSGGHPLNTVYSFVPIPGTHQQKRPRRRYEEIERMYKCGWNGCEKAYGTLNHLNAHVTMQSHGAKRTPEEFKEIRKEWKQKKKEEDNLRKQDEERARQHHQQAVSQGQAVEGQTPSANGSGSGQPSSSNGYPQQPRQLPPIGYAPAGGPVPPQYAGQADSGHMQGVPQYSGSQVPGYGYPPQSPYGQGQQQM